MGAGVASWITVLALAMFTVLLAEPGLQAPPDPKKIVNGSPVEVCGWPTTVFTGGCTGTLVHPKAISTAQHCGTPTSIQFGNQGGAGPTVGVLGCVGDGSQDAMLCELAEEVTQVPVTPVLFGCEAEMYLQPGQPVVMAGFGETAFGVGGGTKLWANQTINVVEPGRVIVGEGGDGTSPCRGDSGGPVFVQVDDGTWRVFGTVLSGTTGTPCNSAADFQRIDTVVANFEAQRGLDITPCFDGQTGAWDAGPDCGGFFSGDHSHVGSWDNWCEPLPAGGYSATCGEPFGEDPGGSSSGGDEDTEGDSDLSGGTIGTSDGNDDGTTSGSDSDSTSGSGSGSDDDDDDDSEGGSQGDTDTDTDGPYAEPTGSPSSGCGCQSTGDGLPAASLGLLVLLGLRRRQL